MKKIFIIFMVNLLTWSILSCSDSDLLYNTNQKHTIYFDKEKGGVEVKNLTDIYKFSFAYYSFSDTVVDIPVKYMGLPADHIQEFKVKIVPDTIGVTAVDGRDVEFVDLTIAPGEVEGNLKVRLKRSGILADTTYGLSLVFEENEFFVPLNGSHYKLQVSDGELPMPTWWALYPPNRMNNEFLGLYYPEKYKMVLEKFKALENKYPDFYKYAIEEYGEFLHEIPEGSPNNIRWFFRFKYSYIWGKYVFQSVYDYFSNPENALPGDDLSLMKNPIDIYK